MAAGKVTQPSLNLISQVCIHSEGRSFIALVKKILESTQLRNSKRLVRIR